MIILVVTNEIFQTLTFYKQTIFFVLTPNRKSIIHTNLQHLHKKVAHLICYNMISEYSVRLSLHEFKF